MDTYWPRGRPGEDPFMSSEYLDHGRLSDPFDHRYEKLEKMAMGMAPPPVKSHVQGDAKARKAQPIATGCLDYFPDALLAVAELSRIGNDQHSPGQPLHWDRTKSTDEADALLRHLVDRGTRDNDGVRHSAKVAWRALALLQKEIEAERSRQIGNP